MRVGTWNLGSLSGKVGHVCEELRKRMIVECDLQKVRWRGLGARMLEMKGRRNKLRWSGKGDGVGGVGVMVELLCEKVVEIRMVIDRVISVVVLEEHVLRLICRYSPQSWRCSEEKQSIYEE